MESLLSPSPSPSLEVSAEDARYKPPAAPPPDPMWQPRPAAAALLNFYFGLGFVYSGRPVLGILTYHLFMLWAFGLWTLSAYAGTRTLRLSLAGLVFASFFIALPITGYLIARRTSASPKRWSQRWYGLVLFAIAIWAIGPVLTFRIAPGLPAMNRVAGQSMRPTLQLDDRVISTIITSEPHRGDVVAFATPQGAQVIGRVIGVPGDIVELRGFRALINGQPEQPRIGPCEHDESITWPEPLRTRANFGPVTVPPGRYAIAGDCRDNARDFRDTGYVPREVILKKMSWIFWSRRPSRIGQRVE